jgi:hypothetical protein
MKDDFEVLVTALYFRRRSKLCFIDTTNCMRFTFAQHITVIICLLAAQSFAMGLHVESAQAYCGEPAEKTLQAPSYLASRLTNNQLAHSQLAHGKKDMVWAWLSSPTMRYPHTALGSTTHAGGVQVQLKSGQIASYQLPVHRVFEDLSPRLIDLDQDGRDELVLIESDLLHGSAVVVLGLRGDKLIELARSPHTGSTFRWLNIVGVADFDGDGKLDVAAVTTPHIGGTLKLYHFRPPHLVTYASAMDVSNHLMGSKEQQLAVIVEQPQAQPSVRPTVIVPDMTLKALHALRLQANGQWMELSSVMPLPAKVERLSAMKNGACARLTNQTWWRIKLTNE